MTFKDMTFREKADHIWEYYKLHIGGALIGIFIIGSILNTYIFNPAPDIILDFTLRMDEAYCDGNYRVELQDALIEALVEDPKTQDVYVEVLTTNTSTDPQMVMASTAKFTGKAQTEELDLILMDEGMYQMLYEDMEASDSGAYFLDLNDLEAQTGIDLPEAAKQMTTDSQSGENKVYTLDARKLPALSPVIINDEEGAYYVGIFVKSHNAENAMKALEMLSKDSI